MATQRKTPAKDSVGTNDTANPMDEATLAKIAANVKTDIAAEISSDKEVSENPPPEDIETVETEPDASTSIVDDDDDDVFSIGGSSLSQIPDELKLPISAEISSEGESANKNEFITADDLKKALEGMDDETFLATIGNVQEELNTYGKDLILKHGMTVDEAKIASKARLGHRSTEIMTKYFETHPEKVIVEINKKDVDSFEFTADERSKMSSTTKIELVLVEDKTLETLKISKMPVAKKGQLLRKALRSLPKYSIPLPGFGDFVTFTGAQISYLSEAVIYEDSTPQEVMTTKANLVYQCFNGGTLIQKYDEQDNVVMTYNDFINKFMFHDLDLAIYAILIASSTDHGEIMATCEECGKTFKYEYSYAGLLDTTKFDEKTKDVIESILEARANVYEMEKIHDKQCNLTRYKLPFSGNIYEISPPTIGKAISLYQNIDAQNLPEVYASMLSLYTSTIYLYNSDTDDYVEATDEDPAEFAEICRTIPQPDLDLLFKVFQDIIWEPTFAIEAKCSHKDCGHVTRQELSISDMVFQRGGIDTQQSTRT